jgi:hypothetical protein
MGGDGFISDTCPTSFGVLMPVTIEDTHTVPEDIELTVYAPPSETHAIPPSVQSTHVTVQIQCEAEYSSEELECLPLSTGVKLASVATDLATVHRSAAVESKAGNCGDKRGNR